MYIVDKFYVSVRENDKYIITHFTIWMIYYNLAKIVANKISQVSPIFKYSQAHQIETLVRKKREYFGKLKSIWHFGEEKL